jgi:hypothetical protein
VSVSTDRPYLAAVPDSAPAPAPPSIPRPRIRLTDWQRMEVEQARELLMDAPALFDTRPAAYVAGLIEGAASNLLDIIDAVTEV